MRSKRQLKSVRLFGVTRFLRLLRFFKAVILIVFIVAQIRAQLVHLRVLESEGNEIPNDGSDNEDTVQHTWPLLRAVLEFKKFDLSAVPPPTRFPSPRIEEDAISSNDMLLLNVVVSRTSPEANIRQLNG